MQHERRLVLAAAGKMVPFYRGKRVVEQPRRTVEVFASRRTKDGSGKTILTALFICDRGVWDNGTKQLVREGPVSVPWDEKVDPERFYQRAVEAGDLVIVEARPPKDNKASRGSDAATRRGAGGEV